MKKNMYFQRLPRHHAWINYFIAKVFKNEINLIKYMAMLEFASIHDFVGYWLELRNVNESVGRC
jgi:hypothetical protein